MLKYLRVMRPKQWVKNGFVLAPFIFSLQFNIENLQKSLLAALCFILISSAIYIFNDLIDIEQDKKHPTKHNRPIAAGNISIRAASYQMVLLLILGYAVCSYLPRICFFIMMAYLVLNVAYSKILKNHAIVDVLIIASGFVLRVLMGGYAIAIPVSSWIILATFLLALFLAFSKRYNEITQIGEASRASLGGYNAELLGKMITVSCGATLVCYVIYTAEMAKKTGKDALVYTVIFVVFGLFRYLQIVFVNSGGGEPEKVLYRDKLFLLNIILWLISTVYILIY